MRSRYALSALVLCTGLVITGCGSSEETSEEPLSNGTGTGSPDSQTPDETDLEEDPDDESDSTSDNQETYDELPEDEVDLSEFTTSPQEGDFPEASGEPDSILTDIRHGRHEGYERLVLEFSDSPPNDYSAEYTDEAVTGMPDVGETADQMEGLHVLELTIHGLAHEDPDHAPELHGEEPWHAPESQVLSEVELGQLFEGTGTYFVGLEYEAAYHVSHAEDPHRIIVDIATEPNQ